VPQAGRPHPRDLVGRFLERRERRACIAVIDRRGRNGSAVAMSDPDTADASPARPCS
jgi:hypothetical protein